MSSLVVEICEVLNVQPHPNADRLAIATVKGWKTCIKFDPETNKAEFKVGDKCIYFPPDSILPQELANSPEDTPPGRLGVAKYLGSLPKDVNGERPSGGRVKACRLRGIPSYGIITHIDESYGDNPNWPIGTDVKDHFGISKWEPPVETVVGDAEKSHTNFHTYTDIENIANYPTAISEGTEVVFTEKIHGKNCRLGLILDNDGNKPIWTFMAGSHGTRRKKHYIKTKTSNKEHLVKELGIPESTLQENYVFTYRGKPWKVTNITNSIIESKRVKKNGTGEYETKIFISEFWEHLTDNVQSLLNYIKDYYDWQENKHSIILFGEIYGSGVQDMQYGFTNGKRAFRAFDIAINGQYIDFQDKMDLCQKFNVETVPILYQGPFSFDKLEEFTNGPTTICKKKEAGKFKGREGIVITPIKEQITEEMIMTSTNGRLILKSISADYLARREGTDSH